MLPGQWRTLLVQWLRRAPRAKWRTLLADAGHDRLEAARALLDWLLNAGWIVSEEVRTRTGWEALWIEFRQPAELRSALGLADPARFSEQWAIRRAVIAAGSLNAYLGALDQLPSKRAVERADLLEAIERWRDDSRFGTRRDFALFARGSTKKISPAEWQWLEDQLSLETAGIERHTPLLLLRGPMKLVTAMGAIDVQAAPDFIGLTVATVLQVQSIVSSAHRWRVVENRTSFERVARAHGSQDAIVWVPGFAPHWWLEAMASLLGFAPADAFIACDPDPSGIEIAVAVGKVWEAAKLAWVPWMMSAAALQNLPLRMPLSPFDRAKLDGLLRQRLPSDLEGLANWMNEHGVKGEQEGFL